MRRRRAPNRQAMMRRKGKQRMPRRLRRYRGGTLSTRKLLLARGWRLHMAQPLSSSSSSRALSLLRKGRAIGGNVLVFVW